MTATQREAKKAQILKQRDEAVAILNKREEASAVMHACNGYLQRMADEDAEEKTEQDPARSLAAVGGHTHGEKE